MEFSYFDFHVTFFFLFLLHFLSNPVKKIFNLYFDPSWNEFKYWAVSLIASMNSKLEKVYSDIIVHFLDFFL